MSDKYILEGHEAIECNDLMKWSAWFETADRHVAKTKITDEISVSTVFLALDHSFGGGPPMLFETMVFGGPLDGQMERYRTWEFAELGHKIWVSKASH